MITSFYFDSELFDDTALMDQPLANSTLLENWRRFGCLIFNDSNSESFVNAIKKVSPKYYQDWLTAISSYKKVKVNFETEIMSQFQDFNSMKGALLPLGIDTALISSDYAELYKDCNCNETNFELITPSNINESVNFSCSNKFTSQSIKSTESIQEIWDTRFQGLALYTKVITIIDRFAVKNMIEDYKSGLQTSIELFIAKLPKNGKKYSIQLYSACDIGTPTNVTELKAYLTDVLSKKTYYQLGIQSFTISLCKNNFFGKEAHDRMLKFDDHIIEIGNGLDIFRETPILNNTFSIKLPESTNFTTIHGNLNKNIEIGCRNIKPNSSN